MRSLLCILLLVIPALKAVPQDKNRDFVIRVIYQGNRLKALIEEQHDLKVLLEQYKTTARDSNAVQRLLQINQIYLHRMSDADHVLDSSILLARQARDLSVKLKYTGGYDESTYMLATAYIQKKDYKSALSIINKSTGELRVRLLILFAETYLFTPGEIPQNLDTAYAYILQAREISNSLSSPWPRYSCLRFMGKYFFSRGDISQGVTCFKSVIDELHVAGDSASEAFWWQELGHYMPETDSTYEDEIHYIEKALSLYDRLKLTSEQPYLHRDLAGMYERHSENDLAEFHGLKALELKKASGEKNFHTYYNFLITIYRAKGSYDKALYYCLEAIQNADSLGDFANLGIQYYELGKVYQLMGDAKRSVQSYKTSLDMLIEYKRLRYIFLAAGGIVDGLLKQDKAQEALEFLNDFLKDNVPAYLGDREIIASAKGDCYDAIGKFAQAETEYLKMISLDEEAVEHRLRETAVFRILGTEAYLKIGRFYLKRKRYTVTRPYLEKALSLKHYPPSLSQKKDIYLILFKVDSAEGKYASAIHNLQMHQVLNDSIFNDHKSKQISELQIKYETDKKEQDLRVLRSTEQVQLQKIQRADTERNFTYVLLSTLLLALGLGYSRYRLKQKSNSQLQVKQDEINIKNISLQQLVMEKDWLIKEIHHRVKNNFHFVIGLLNTQSQYLKSPEAVMAVEESQQRIHTMSLIHQKLYQSENLSAIYMPDYIFELVEYLKDCFKTERRIRFDLQVEPIELDLTHSLPIGLILNEAITNSIKYAFPDGRDGCVAIALSYQSEHHLLLTISDNGIGMPADVYREKSNTMGMNLMHGLTDDIDGTFSIENKGGACVRIAFQYVPTFTDDLTSTSINQTRSV